MTTTKKTYNLTENTIDIYFQKSHRFLYPLLRISSESKIVPQTYLAWEGVVGINDYKLICVYTLREDAEFKKFERNILQGNEFFEDYKETDSNTGVYIFNLTPYKDDVRLFLKGQYSKMSEFTKDILLHYYKNNRASREYMDSFLNPSENFARWKTADEYQKESEKRIPFSEESYYERYADLLGMHQEDLRNAVELCNRFDREKETFTANILEPKL